MTMTLSWGHIKIKMEGLKTVSMKELNVILIYESGKQIEVPCKTVDDTIDLCNMLSKYYETKNLTVLLPEQLN